MKEIKYYKLIIAVVVVIGMFSNCMQSGKQNNGFSLVKNSTPNVTIVISSNPCSAVKLAAIELQHHVKLISGAFLPIKNDLKQVEGNKIHIGNTKFTEQLGY